MKDTANSYVGSVIATVLIMTYLGGYVAIRAQCSGSAPYFFVPTSNTTLITIYKPLFYAERKLAGHHFSTSLWSPDAGF